MEHDESVTHPVKPVNTPVPVSKLEAEALRTMLARPKPQMALMPSGPVVQAVHTAHDQQVRNRIAEIEGKLKARREQAKNDFNYATEKGRAKSAFRRAAR